MSYYVRAGDHAYRPTEFAGGAWNPTEVHFAPLSALLLHEVDLHRASLGEAAANLARVSFDILGFLGQGECTITVETIRPGRTIELVEAVAAIDGRTVVRARAWFLAAFDTSAVAGGMPDPLPSPDAVETWPLAEGWSGGFVHSLDVRAISRPQPGRATVWMSSPHELIEGETVSDTAAFLRLADTANGIAVRERPTEWVFPNVDLTIHLYRQPVPGWIGLDTTVVFGGAGVGVTQTVLYDVNGPVGVAHQALTVRPVG